MKQGELYMTKDGRHVRRIRLYGYEYHLVEICDGARKGYGKFIGIPLPCCMGHKNFALMKVKRLNWKQLKKIKENE